MGRNGSNGKELNDAERDSADINVSAFLMGPALSLASCSPLVHSSQIMYVTSDVTVG